MLLGLKDKITFGKYKGSTIEEIIKINFMYLYWATENIDWFALTEEAQEALPNKKIYDPYSVDRNEDEDGNNPLDEVFDEQF